MHTPVYERAVSRVTLSPGTIRPGNFRPFIRVAKSKWVTFSMIAFETSEEVGRGEINIPLTIGRANIDPRQILLYRVKRLHLKKIILAHMTFHRVNISSESFIIRLTHSIVCKKIYLKNV